MAHLKKSQLIACLILLVGATTLAGCSSSKGTLDKTAADNSQHETSLQRVLRTGKIRCSYLLYSYYFQKDPNSGKLSGIFYDVMEEIGRRSDLKIDWVEEVGFQNIFPGLNANRCDVFCGGLWPNATRAKAALFTRPVFYSAITAWCRPDDNRFSKDLSTINSPSFKIATIDGAMEDLIARADFPLAKRESLPELSPFVQNLLNVVGKKADKPAAADPIAPLAMVRNAIADPRGELGVAPAPRPRLADANVAIHVHIA